LFLFFVFSSNVSNSSFFVRFFPFLFYFFSFFGFCFHPYLANIVALSCFLYSQLCVCVCGLACECGSSVHPDGDFLAAARDPGDGRGAVTFAIDSGRDSGCLCCVRLRDVSARSLGDAGREAGKLRAGGGRGGLFFLFDCCLEQCVSLFYFAFFFFQ
jgi:hypothetical protein